MRSGKPCLLCGEVMSPEWARPDQKYCDRSCKDAFWYKTKYKAVKAARYQMLKREWERSDNGKRSEVSFSLWLRLPKDWR